MPIMISVNKSHSTVILVVLLGLSAVALAAAGDAKANPMLSSASSTNKYKEREQVDPKSITAAKDYANVTAGVHVCFFKDVDVMWQTKLDAHIYSTPTITDFDGDGRKEVITASMHYIDVVHADDGSRVHGWPFGLSQTTFVADPILYDLDNDGVDEIVACTQDGFIIFLTKFGEIVSGATLKVPKLKVAKDWYKGLPNGKNVDAFIDLSAEHKEGEAALRESDPQFLKSKKPKISQHRPPTAEDEEASGKDMDSAKEIWKHFEGWLDEAGVKSLELFLPVKHVNDYEEQTALFSQNQADEPQTPDSEFIMVDSHILATPVIADIDGDGKDEIIVSASYYFDDVVALDMSRLEHLPFDVVLRNYVASSIIVFELDSLHVKWYTPFELTTEASSHKGYSYAPPTVVDLDGDGKLDIIAATAFGAVHVLDHHGLPRSGMKPISMDAIYSAVVADDVNGDGKLEFIVVDAGANVACYNLNGDELWENRIAGVAHSNPVLGDVNGDNQTDIIIATDAGFVYGLDALTGRLLDGFPVKVGGPILASPVLIPPVESSGLRGLGVGVSSVDGHFYIIHAPYPWEGLRKQQGMGIGPFHASLLPTSCIEKIDVGEGSHSALLVDDFSNDGRMNILLATSAGHLYAFSTEMHVGKYGHLASWTSPMHGRNVYKALVNEGIKFTDETRRRVQISGSSFDVSVDLNFIESTVKSVFKNQQWRLKFSIGRRVLGQTVVFGPGRHTIRLPAPDHRWRTALTVEAVNVHGQAFFDRIHLEFNTNFGEMLGWLILVPFVVATSILLFVKDVKALLPN